MVEIIAYREVNGRIPQSFTNIPKDVESIFENVKQARETLSFLLKNNGSLDFVYREKAKSINQS